MMFSQIFLRPLSAIVLGVLRLWVAWVYGKKTIDADHLPTDGGLLLVANRSTTIDEILIAVSLSRRVLFYNPGKSRLRDFLSAGESPADAESVRAALAAGRIVCVFPESARSRTGQLGTFSEDFLTFVDPCGNPSSDGVVSDRAILDRISTPPSVPVIPVFVGGMLGSYWSLSSRRNGFGSWRRLPERPFIAFGEPLRASAENRLTVLRLVYALEELGVDALEKIDRRLPIPQRTLVQNCRKKGRKLLLADSLGVKMNGYAFLIRALIARRLLKREVLGLQEKNVGLFLPMSVAGCVVNAALALDRRVSVNLNNTFGPEILDSCIRQAEIKQILTSRKILEKFPDLKLAAPFVCLEDLFRRVQWRDKLLGIFDGVVLPQRILHWKLGLSHIDDTDALSIIFTSGSTGKPKGVVLSHRNIAYVARGFFETIRVRSNDMMLGVLPFFHAFGYVGNFWLVFLSGCSGALHFNPLEAKIVGQMAKKFRCTFLPITPTFLRLYLKRSPPKDFAETLTVLTGAEKLPADLITTWEERFVARPTEGYGATELSPCPMVNIPEIRFPFLSSQEEGAFRALPTPNDRSVGAMGGQIYRKDGSVGRPFVSTAVKIVDPETGVERKVDEIGMMIVKGPFVMNEYYNQPEETRKAVRDGWYWTGDLAKRDRDGFLWITGRQNRISKIGGEMVPHILIEEVIEKIINDEMSNDALQNDANPSVANDGEMSPETSSVLSCAVSAVPDERKGERIVVLLRRGTLSPERILKQMRTLAIPNLWIPDPGAFIEVESIPILGTGKLDLAAIARTFYSSPLLPTGVFPTQHSASDGRGQR